MLFYAINYNYKNIFFKVTYFKNTVRFSLTIDKFVLQLDQVNFAVGGVACENTQKKRKNTQFLTPCKVRCVKL